MGMIGKVIRLSDGLTFEVRDRTSLVGHLNISEREFYKALLGKMAECDFFSLTSENNKNAAQFGIRNTNDTVTIAVGLDGKKMLIKVSLEDTLTLFSSNTEVFAEIKEQNVETPKKR